MKKCNHDWKFQVNVICEFPLGSFQHINKQAMRSRHARILGVDWSSGLLAYCEKCGDIMWKNPVLQKMWNCSLGGPYVFAYAEIVEPMKFREWNGNHPVEKNIRIKTYPAGTKVICTMVSRFGDVGIRARNINEVRHGYDCRVPPEKLMNIVEIEQ